MLVIGIVVAAFIQPGLVKFTSVRCSTGVHCSTGSGDEKRLVKRTNNPALVWFDELFDTPSERADRERRAQENIKKWGVILSGKDTFDDTLYNELKDEAEQAAATKMKSIGGVPADWALVGGSAIALIGCAAAGLSRGGTPTMSFVN